MKKVLLSALVICATIHLTAFTIAKKYGDIFQEIGIENAIAKEFIFTNFQTASGQFPTTSVAVKLAAGKRAAAVKEIGDFMKAYTESKEFVEQYESARNDAKPQGAGSAEERIKARLEELKSDIKTTEEDMKEASNDAKKLYEITLAELQKEWKALSNPSDALHNRYVAQATGTSPEQKTAYAQQMKDWEQAYPSTIQALVKARLVEFLSLTATIDFNAKLVKKGSHMVFADPAVEAKDYRWKSCFRSGKETVMAARAYAQQWLASLK